MNEAVSIGGRHVAGFALGDTQAASTVAPIARSAAVWGVVAGGVGALVDYARTGSIGWQVPATFATVGAIGGGILGAI